jgi:hypothetical protein
MAASAALAWVILALIALAAAEEAPALPRGRGAAPQPGAQSGARRGAALRPAAPPRRRGLPLSQSARGRPAAAHKRPAFRRGPPQAAQAAPRAPAARCAARLPAPHPARPRAPGRPSPPPPPQATSSRSLTSMGTTTKPWRPSSEAIR